MLAPRLTGSCLAWVSLTGSWAWPEAAAFRVPEPLTCVTSGEGSAALLLPWLQLRPAEQL